MPDKNKNSTKSGAGGKKTSKANFVVSKTFKIGSPDPYLILMNLFMNMFSMAADDMGLGKTLTMISLVLKQREAAGAAGKTAGKDKKKEEEWLARNSESFP